MNPTRINIIAALVLAMAAGWVAPPQAHAAGTTDFSAFKLVTDRNIFDPNRYPHIPGYHRRPQISRSAPAFALVGTMNYRKGMFAFFDGNSPDYRLALQKDGVIAGYTVTDITLAGVTLKPAGTNSVPLDFEIGSQMRLNGSDWELTGTEEDLTTPASAVEGSPAATEDSTTPTPSGSSAPVSDVLKRLMQQRAQETK